MLGRHGVQGEFQWWGRHELRDAAVILVLRADLNIGAERRRDLVAHELFECLAGRPPDHLADRMAVVDRVITGRSSGWPPRCLTREMAGRLLPVIDVLDGKRWFPAGNTRRVRQEMAHLDVCLPLSANSGQYFATGAKASTKPRSIAINAARAVSVFVQEKKLTIVFRPHGTVLARSA